MNDLNEEFYSTLRREAGEEQEESRDVPIDESLLDLEREKEEKRGWWEKGEGAGREGRKSRGSNGYLSGRVQSESKSFKQIINKGNSSSSSSCQRSDNLIDGEEADALRTVEKG